MALMLQRQSRVGPRKRLPGVDGEDGAESCRGEGNTRQSGAIFVGALIGIGILCVFGALGAVAWTSVGPGHVGYPSTAGAVLLGGLSTAVLSFAFGVAGTSPREHPTGSSASTRWSTAWRRGR